jgi:hypothetical protein
LSQLNNASITLLRELKAKDRGCLVSPGTMMCHLAGPSHPDTRRFCLLSTAAYSGSLFFFPSFFFSLFFLFGKS